MPIIPTDEADVAVQAAAPSMIPQTRLSNAVGEGMVAAARAEGGLAEAVGGVVTNLGLAYEKRVIEAETSEANVKMEEWKQQQTLREAEERDKVQDFGTGYAQRRIDERNKESEAFIKSLPPRQQERAREMVASYQSSRVGDDANFETRRRAQHASDLNKRALDNDSSEIAKNPDVNAVQGMIARREAEIDQMPVNAEEKARLKQEYRNGIISNQNAEAIAKRNGQAASAIATYGAPSVQAGFNTILQNETGHLRTDAEKDRAISPAGAVGRAQIMPGTARELLAEAGDPAARMNDQELTRWLQDNPDRATNLGRNYWVKMLERYKTPNGTYDYEAAAIAYNGGPRRADEFIASGRNYSVLPQETRTYAQRFKERFVGNQQQGGLGLPGAPAGGAPLASQRETGYLTPQTPYRGANRYNFSDFKNDGQMGGSAGGQARIDMSVVRVADGIAAAIGTKLPVTSAFRSPSYNATVASSRNSPHSHGNALDLDLKVLDDVQKQAAVRAAVANGATGLGTYPNGSMHIDTRQQSGRGPGGLSLWYGHNNGSFESAPAWFQNGVREGLAARAASQGGAAAPADPIAPAGPGGGPGTREEGQVPGGSRETPAAPAQGQPPVNVQAPGADIGPGAVAGTAGGGVLQALPQDPGPFRQQLPGESYDTYAKNRAAHDANRNSIISMRNNADGAALKELNSNNEAQRQQAVQEFTNKLFSGEANRSDIQRAIDSGLVRDNKDLHTMLQAEAQYQSAVDRGMRAYEAQRNADRQAYVEQQKQKSMLGQLEETDVMTDMQAGRITADEASGLINRIRTWKKGQDGGYSAVARVQTGPIGSAYNKEDRDVANTAYDHMVKNSGAKTQQEIDAYSARVAAAIVNKWGFAPDDHVEKLAGQAMTGNAQRTIAAAAEAAQLLRSNPAAFDQAGEAGKTILRVASDYATMLSQGYTDAEMAERIKKMAEPKFAQENADQMKRGGILGDALKGVQEMSADDLSKKIGRAGDGWLFTGSRVGIDEKYGNAVKLTPQSSSALKAEYESIYKRELTMTGDPKMAENRTVTFMSKNYGETKFGGAAAQRGPLFTSFDGTSFVKYPIEKIVAPNFAPSTPVATIQAEVERQARDHLISSGVTTKPDRIVLVPQFASPRTELIDGKNPNAYTVAYLDRSGNMRIAKELFFFDANKANRQVTDRYRNAQDTINSVRSPRGPDPVQFQAGLDRMIGRGSPPSQ